MMSTPDVTTSPLFAAMQRLIDQNPDYAPFARIIARSIPLGDDEAMKAAVNKQLKRWGAQDDPHYKGAYEVMMKLVKLFQFQQ